MSFAKEVPDSDQTSTVDPFQRLQIQPNTDGSIKRKFNFFPDVPPSSDPKLPVLSKDIPINQSNNTWLRLYLPRHVLDQPSTTSATKLPLVVFFHGGGFIFFSSASKNSHDFCFNFAAEVPVVIASVDYRLAPEHRLPAAYDDAMEALQWIKTSRDGWLRDHADLSNCFLMGSSAGANIAYHAGLRVATAEGVDLLHPLKIRGLIFTQAFFGGIRRTDSEMRLVNDPIVVPSVTDLMWDLSLPLGVDRDHEYCNPTVGNVSNRLDQVKALGWRVLVTGCDGDPLIDRQSVLVKMLEDNGVEVVSHVSEGGHHGILTSDLSKAKLFYLLVKQFIYA